jgi:hypothetical protein
MEGENVARQPQTARPYGFEHCADDVELDLDQPIIG